MIEPVTASMPSLDVRWSFARRGVDLAVGAMAVLVMLYKAPLALPDIVRFSLVFAALFLVPGYLLLRLLRRQGLDIVEYAALSLSCSVLALVPVTVVAYVQELTLERFLAGCAATIALLAVAAAARRPASSGASGWWSVENATLLALMLVLSAIGSALIYRFARYVPRGWDVFEHIAAVRKLIALPRINSYDGPTMGYVSGTGRDFSYAYNIWELLTATLVRASQTDLLQSWRWLAAAIVPFTLASKYFLSKSLFGEKNTRVAWIAAGVYWIYKFVYTTVRADTIYLQFLNQPGPVNAEVLMPVAIGCLFLFVRQADRTWLGLGSLIVAALLFMHAVEWFNTLALLSVSATILWGCALLAQERDFATAARMTWTVLASVVAGFVTLAIPLKWHVYTSSPIPHSGLISVDYGTSYIKVFGDRLIQNPEVGFADKIVTLGLLMLLPVLLSRASAAAKALCASAPVVLVLLAFNPFLTGFIIKRLSVVVPQRAYEGPIWLMIVALGTYMLIDPIVDRIGVRFRRVGPLGLATLMAWLVLLNVTLAGAASPWSFRTLVKRSFTEATSHTALDVFDRTAIVAALRKLPPGSEVFTDADAGFQLPAFVPIYVNAFGRDSEIEDGPKRSADAREAFAARTTPVRFLEILRSYRSEYVVLSKRGGSLQAGWKFDALFDALYRDENYALYRVGNAKNDEVVWINLFDRMADAKIIGAPAHSMTAKGGARLEQAGVPLRDSLALFPSSSTRMEFPLVLTSKPVFRFGVEMEPTSYVNACSDGACFAVNVLERGRTQQMFSQCLTPKTVEKDTNWHDHSLDLSAYTGKQITLALETTPGPANNSSCDYAYWSTLILQQGRTRR